MRLLLTSCGPLSRVFPKRRSGASGALPFRRGDMFRRASGDAALLFMPIASAVRVALSRAIGACIARPCKSGNSGSAHVLDRSAA